MLRHILRQLLPERVARLVGASARRARVIEIGIGAGLRFDPGPSNSAYARGDNELPVQDAIAQHLRSGDVFYDVGANVGFLTVIAARAVTGSGTVYAFEPVAANVALIRSNAAVNRLHNISVFQGAVGSTSGQAELVLANYSGGSVLASAQAPPDAIGRISVELVSIDDLVFARKFRPPTVVKIDVEGTEVDVLHGMQRTLRQYAPTVIYELDDAKADRMQRKRQSCEEFLRGAGYRVTQLPSSYPGINWYVEHFVARPAIG